MSTSCSTWLSGNPPNHPSRSAPMTSTVQRTTEAASSLNHSSISGSVHARSWLPTRVSQPRCTTSSTHLLGSPPYPTTSPRHKVSSTCGQSEHRVQRLPVGVDVREDRDLQAGFSYRRG